MKRVFAALMVFVTASLAQTAGLTWDEANRLAIQHWQQRDWSAADTLIRRAVHEAERFGGADPRLAAALNNFGAIEQDSGRYLQAEAAYRRALEVWTAAADFGKNRIQTLTSLARMYVETHQSSTAEQLHDDLLASLDRTDLDSNARATVLDTLGEIAYSNHKIEDARRLYHLALDVSRAAGEPTSGTAAVLNNLALLSLADGRPTEARSHFQRALAICEWLDLPDVVVERANLAVLDCQQSHFTDAEAEARQAVDDSERIWGPEHVLTGEVLLVFARAERGLRRKKEAAKLEWRAQRILHDRAPETGRGYRVDASELGLHSRF